MLTHDQLNRSTLRRQLLLERADVPVVEAVGRAVAIQAQEPAAPYVALWNRVEGFDPVALDGAFDTGALLRATLMRVTLHVVTAADHPVFRSAMLPRLRASRVNDRRFRDEGLEPDDADALLTDLAAVAGEARSPAELVEALGDRLGRQVPQRVWWALRTYGPVVRTPDASAWSFGRGVSFVAAPTRDDDLPDRDEAVRLLVHRSLRGFGPSSVADLARFTLLRRATVRAAIEGLGDRVVKCVGPDGVALFDDADSTVGDGDEPAPPRLLGMWDSTLFAHVDGARLMADDLRPVVVRRNGDTLPTVLVDGRVAGVWRHVPDGIEVTPLARIDDDVWEGLAGEASSLLAMVDGRDEAVFGRYARWWDRLPSEGRRVIGR